MHSQKPRTTFYFDQNPADHGQRYKAILKQHPEIKKLFGINRWSFVILAGLVCLQNAIGYFLNSQPIWVAVITSYLFGSVIALAIMALVHDASHNLITKSKFGNNAALFVANMGILWPASLAYRRYHLNHHRYFGQSDGDLICQLTKKLSLWEIDLVRSYSGSCFSVLLCTIPICKR